MVVVGAVSVFSPVTVHQKSDRLTEPDSAKVFGGMVRHKVADVPGSCESRWRVVVVQNHSSKLPPLVKSRAALRFLGSWGTFGSSFFLASSSRIDL